MLLFSFKLKPIRRLFRKRQRLTLNWLGFLQAFGLVIYCSLVGFLIWQGEEWFGPVHRFWGPVFFLALLVVSVLICALLALGYPIFLFWIQRRRRAALNLVIQTAVWLLVLVLLILLGMVVAAG